MTLNKISFYFQKEIKEDGFDKYIYKSNDDQITLIIYKLKVIVPFKGIPFSKKVKDKFNELDYSYKKYKVLPDYYHNIFIMYSTNGTKNIDDLYNDYATLIYCKVNKNKKLHPKYIVFGKNNFCEN